MNSNYNKFHNDEFNNPPAYVCNQTQAHCGPNPQYNCNPSTPPCPPTPPQPMGWDGCNGVVPECGGTVVPPPIPPVRYVPGMNVQEQLCNMAERVNISINRWNQIQRNCYEALDNVVGAAVSNDVYYSPEEVKIFDGYDEDSSCPYTVVEARSVDRSGRPIFCRLRPAYNNVTNSGAQEKITDVSFVTSGQMVISAIQGNKNRWQGTSLFCGNPGNSAPDDTVYVGGWNRNGALKFFRGDVTPEELIKNRMVDVVGPVIPVLLNGEIFNDGVAASASTPGSVQAIGWKRFNGNKVFFSCSNYDAPGMSVQAVAKVLQNMGCDTAIVTSYMVEPATAWDANPAAGTEARDAAQDGVITAPGMTGGMTFLGKLTTAPLQWNIPANCCNWIISKRPGPGWNNAFTTEIANVVQRLGSQSNQLDSIQSQLTDEAKDLTKLKTDVESNKQNITVLTSKMGAAETKISALESSLESVNTSIENINTRIDNEITLREQQYNELKTAIDNEVTQRQSADSALDAKITAEQVARSSADTVLQTNIDAEATNREAEDTKLSNAITAETSAREAADNALKGDIDTVQTNFEAADRNLQNAINAEMSARSTKDTEHEARMDAITAKEAQDISLVNQEIANIKDGSALPVATSTTLGAFKVGNNLSITPDGVLSATGGGGGSDINIVAGENISVSKAGNDVTVGTTTKFGQTVTDAYNNANTALNTANEAKTTADSAKTSADTATATANDAKTTADTANATATSAKVEAESANDLAQGATDRVTLIEAADQVRDNEINALKTDVANANTNISKLQSGEGLPKASASTLGGIKVGANLSISDDGVLSASGGGGTGTSVAAGEGLKAETDETTKITTVSLNQATQDTLSAVANKAESSTVAANAAKIAEVETAVNAKANQADLDTLNAEVQKIVDAGGEVAIQAGQGIDIDTTTESGKAIISINADTQTKLNTASDTAAQNTTAIAGLRTELDGVQTTVGQHTTDITNINNALSEKVSKAGDTVTGSLRFNGEEAGRNVVISNGGVVFNENTTIYSDNGQVNLAGPENANVIIGGVADGVADNDAVNNKQLKAVDQLAEDAVADAASAQTTANNAQTAANEAKNQATSAETVASSAYTLADNIKNGTEKLPYLQSTYNTETVKALAIANGVIQWQDNTEYTPPVQVELVGIATTKNLYSAVNNSRLLSVVQDKRNKYSQPMVFDDNQTEISFSSPDTLNPGVSGAKAIGNTLIIDFNFTPTSNIQPNTQCNITFKVYGGYVDNIEAQDFIGIIERGYSPVTVPLYCSVYKGGIAGAYGLDFTGDILFEANQIFRLRVFMTVSRTLQN